MRVLDRLEQAIVRWVRSVTWTIELPREMAGSLPWPKGDVRRLVRALADLGYDEHETRRRLEEAAAAGRSPLDLVIAAEEDLDRTPAAR